MFACNYPKILFTLLTSFAVTGYAQVWTVETVPNIKLDNNSYVSNPDRLLTAETVARIDSLLGGVEARTSAQVAVVVLESIGDVTPFEFSQALYRKWGIGDAKNSNGLLVLYVNNPHGIRLHTGYGMEGILPDAVCKQIERDVMIPWFKANNIDKGVYDGLLEVARVLEDPAHAEELKEAIRTERKEPGLEGISFFLIIGWVAIGLIVFLVKRKRGFADSPAVLSNKAPHTKLSRMSWLLFWIVVPVAVIVYLTFVGNDLLYFGGIYAYVGVMAIASRVRLAGVTNKWIEKNQHHRVYDYYKESEAKWLWTAVFFPLPFAFMYGAAKRRGESIRVMPRPCKNCGKLTARLDEASDDSHLEKFQAFEEELKSVDYDVWLCGSCNATQIESYPYKQSTYEACPKCTAVAYKTESITTLVEPTYSATGTREIIRACKYCQYGNVQQETIAQLTADSSDSSSSSGSSSSSSSDSGGSWGGGDSGGGGADSTW